MHFLKRVTIKRLVTRFFISLLIGSCVGCGYQSYAMRAKSTERVSIALPLIHEDSNGVLRDAIAQELSKTGVFHYSSSLSAQYTLQVKVISDSSETIGYVWDSDPITGALIERLYPNEGRRMEVLEVSLIDTKSTEKVLPSFKIRGDTNYDFVNPTALKNIEFTDIQGNRKSVLQYSLGQLDSEEGAKLEAEIPLSQSLANKLVEVLLRSYFFNIKPSSKTL